MFWAGSQVEAMTIYPATPRGQGVASDLPADHEPSHEAWAAEQRAWFALRLGEV